MADLPAELDPRTGRTPGFAGPGREANPGFAMQQGGLATVQPNLCPGGGTTRPFREAAMRSYPVRYWRLGSGAAQEYDEVVRGLAAQSGFASTASLILDGDGAANLFDGSTASFQDLSAAGEYVNGVGHAYGLWLTRDAADNGGVIFGGSAATSPRLAFSGTSDTITWQPELGGLTATWTGTGIEPGTGPWFIVLSIPSLLAGIGVLYVNGVNLGTQVAAQGFNASPGNFTVGTSNTTGFFKGTVDEILVWDRQLLAPIPRELWLAGTSLAAETPVPGGGEGAGFEPTALVPVSQGGAVAGGTEPGETTETTETPTPGGAPAGGDSPTARVSVAAGGALAAGVAPSATQSATPTPGGALAGGSGPVARVSAAAGGALAGGVAPAQQITAPVTPGGATAQGAAPAARVPTPQGGATAGGVAPVSRTAVVAGGATAQGVEPAARVPVAQGGAQAGGNAPAEDVGGVSETPVPGGAVAQGGSPTARATVSAGGAQAAGQVPTARVTVAQGSALGGGVGATVRVTITPAGALAGGVAPTENIAGGDNVPAGGALAGGRGPTTRVTIVIGGALAGGTEPGFVSGDVAPVGGALAAGRGPSARVSLAAGGATAGGTGPYDQIAEAAYDVAVLEDEPALYWRLGEYV